MDIFRNTATSVPTKDDPQIDRLDMNVAEISGRKSILPEQQVSPDLPLSHVPSK